MIRNHCYTMRIITVITDISIIGMCSKFSSAYDMYIIID